MRNRYTTLSILIVALTAWGCERAEPLEPGGGAGLEPTLESIQANIFDVNCALSGCHVGNQAPLGLDLSSGNARANLVNVPSVEIPAVLRVKPGDADSSYVVWKIEGRPEIIQERMPRGRPALAPAEISVIITWIENGAVD